MRRDGFAGEQGFEPRLCGPEPQVLPLDDSPEVATFLSARLQTEPDFSGLIKPNAKIIIYYLKNQVKSSWKSDFPNIYDFPEK